MEVDQQTEPPTPARRLRIDGIECVVCNETPEEHHIGCINGHGGCVECMTREKLRGATCPLCRLPMLDTLIPNLALDAAVRATLAVVAAPVLAPKRPRPAVDAEAQQQARDRKAQRLAERAAALNGDPLDE